MSTSRPVVRSAGQYLGSIFTSTFRTTNDCVDIFSATVVYIGEVGTEHASGYDHPCVGSLRSMPWFVRKAVCWDYGFEISLIARDFQRDLDKMGHRFELAHPSWGAPGIEEQPPYRADDDLGDLLAA